ncbi:hypothetical protein [Serratia sp. CY33802]|uniref:hypothetical protein n=1 Tax=Serratia sp. CY33802 TaxID=3383603 RepID=UPI003F9FE30D
MMDEERMTYEELRAEYLDCFYSCCRSHINAFNKNGTTWEYGIEEIGYASYQYENAQLSPVEMLMLKVFTLILIAGRGPKDVENNYRSSISSILEKTNLESLIQGIGEDEKSDLLYDMELLGLLEKPE